MSTNPLRQFSDDKLTDELDRRHSLRTTGLCDYCEQPPSTPACSHDIRHYHLNVIRGAYLGKFIDITDPQCCGCGAAKPLSHPTHHQGHAFNYGMAGLCETIEMVPDPNHARPSQASRVIGLILDWGMGYVFKPHLEIVVIPNYGTTTADATGSAPKVQDILNKKSKDILK